MLPTHLVIALLCAFMTTQAAAEELNTKSSTPSSGASEQSAYTDAGGNLQMKTPSSAQSGPNNTAAISSPDVLPPSAAPMPNANPSPVKLSPPNANTSNAALPNTNPPATNTNTPNLSSVNGMPTSSSNTNTPSAQPNPSNTHLPNAMPLPPPSNTRSFLSSPNTMPPKTMPLNRESPTVNSGASHP